MLITILEFEPPRAVALDPSQVVLVVPELRGGQAARLALGAAHRAGVLTLLPAESEASQATANPIGEDGSIDLSKASSEQRHADIAKQLATRKPLAVIVLGAGHDLGDALPPGTEYLRVRTKRVEELMRE